MSGVHLPSPRPSTASLLLLLLRQYYHPFPQQLSTVSMKKIAYPLLFFYAALSFVTPWLLRTGRKRQIQPYIRYRCLSRHFTVHHQQAGSSTADCHPAAATPARPKAGQTLHESAEGGKAPPPRSAAEATTHTGSLHSGFPSFAVVASSSSSSARMIHHQYHIGYITRATLRRREETHSFVL